MPALAPNSLIAVTGISGYIASHVGYTALQAGHRVRGTVRSLDRAESLKAGYLKQGIPASDLDARLEFVIVDDLLSFDQWRNAIQGVDGIVHLAVSLGNIGDRGFIDIAIEGTLSILRAARQVPSIKRIVLTSTSCAVVSPGFYYDKVLTGEDWNDDAIRIVEQNEPMDKDPIIRKAAPFIIYAVGKTKAEKAAWAFVENEKPQFDLVSILPGTIVGPILHGEPQSTAAWMGSLLKNDPAIMHTLPEQWYIDVRDCGRLHALGLTDASVGGKRILGDAAPFGWNQILAILRKNFPSVRVPEDIENGEPDRQRIDNQVATELLGGWIGLERSLVDLAKSMGY